MRRRLHLQEPYSRVWSALRRSVFVVDALISPDSVTTIDIAIRADVCDFLREFPVRLPHGVDRLVVIDVGAHVILESSDLIVICDGLSDIYGGIQCVIAILVNIFQDNQVNVEL